MSDISSRLCKLIEDKGLTPYKLSKRIGVSQSTLSRIINKNTVPNESNLQAIVKYFKIDEQWFLTGVKEEINQVSDNDIDYNAEASEIDLSKVNVMLVPLVNQYAYGGYLNGFADNEFIEELPKIPFTNNREPKGDYLCFEVRGDSMDDGSYESYLEGDILLCRNVWQDFWTSKLHIKKWDFVIVHKDRGILVKRISDHNVEKGTLLLHSLNEYYEDIEVHIKDIAKIFNIVDFRRKRNRR